MTLLIKTKLFESVADNWFEEHSEKLAFTTADKYKPHIKFIKEYFSDAYIEDITPNDIKNIITRRLIWDILKRLYSIRCPF